MLKKIIHILRFLALVFLLFLAIVLCFVLNKALDAKIQAKQAESLNNFKQSETLYEEEK